MESTDPVRLLLVEISLLEFQAAEIEAMLPSLVGEQERRLWADFAIKLREAAARKSSELSALGQARMGGSQDLAAKEQ